MYMDIYILMNNSSLYFDFWYRKLNQHISFFWSKINIYPKLSFPAFKGIHLTLYKKKKEIHLTYIKKKERKRNPSYILTKQKMESISYGKMSRSFQRHFFFPFPPFFGYSLNSFLASEFSYLNVSLLIRSMFILFYK